MDAPYVRSEKVRQPFSGYIMLAVVLVLLVVLAVAGSRADASDSGALVALSIQTDSAVRQLAASYPYDHFEDERATVTLSTDLNEVNSTLEKEISDRLSSKNIINLDEKKAAMVSNLMVVLCGNRESQPVVNTGTLNH